MSDDSTLPAPHPTGGQPVVGPSAMPDPAMLDTFAGPVRLEWDATTALTPLGQVPFLIEFLEVSGRLDAWVPDCPLIYRSPNAPEKRDELGIIMLAI